MNAFLRYLPPLLVIFFSLNGLAQKKQEQEFRIVKEGLPKKVLPLLSEHLKEVKRLRFYKEQDGDKSSYEIKFKKDRLLYSIEFDENGMLEDVEFIIKPTDIPEDTFKSITPYLKSNHDKYRIKKIQQQHLNSGDAKKTLIEAFQNLILPTIRYEFIIAAKYEKGYGEFEVTFDVEGKHLLTRKSVNPKYDHVLFQ